MTELTQPRKFKMELELEEQDAIELYTIVAVVGKSKVAYEICAACEAVGLDFNTSLLVKPGIEVYFKEKAK